MTLASILVSIGLAVGPALIYAEQAYRMQERRNAEGFSKDVCAVLLIANIARIYWWLPTRYELPLLVQSILMILAQLGLLYLCLLYRPGSFASSSFSVSSSDSQRRGDVLFDAEPPGSGVPREARAAQGSSRPPPHPTFQIRVDPPPEDADGDDAGEGHHAPSHTPRSEDAPTHGRRANGGSSFGVPSLSMQSLELPAIMDNNRPFGFWTWPDFITYIYALLIITAVLGALQLLLGWSSFYVSLLGFFALGLESMLPIPQLVQNHKRQSLAGFQLTVLAGWTFGDAFKVSRAACIARARETAADIASSTVGVLCLELRADPVHPLRHLPARCGSADLRAGVCLPRQDGAGERGDDVDAAAGRGAQTSRARRGRRDGAHRGPSSGAERQQQGRHLCTGATAEQQGWIVCRDEWTRASRSRTRRDRAG